jgi:hypothetical protein
MRCLSGNHLTPRNRVLLDKMTVTQLVKFSTFYGTRSFITVFTWTHQWPLSWTRWIQSTNSHPISLRSLLILWSSDIRLSIFLFSCLTFHNNLDFYGEELLATRPAPKLEDHPLTAIRNCLFSTFIATLHMWRHPEDPTCRCDRDPHNIRHTRM